MLIHQLPSHILLSQYRSIILFWSIAYIEIVVRFPQVDPRTLQPQPQWFPIIELLRHPSITTPLPPSRRIRLSPDAAMPPPAVTRSSTLPRKPVLQHVARRPSVRVRWLTQWKGDWLIAKPRYEVLCCVALRYPHLADWRRASEMWSNRLRPRFPLMCELDGVVTARVHVLLCYGGSGLWRQRASLTIASRLVVCTWTSGPKGVYSVRELSEGWYWIRAV